MSKEKKSRIQIKAENEINIVRAVGKELRRALDLAESEYDEILARVERYSEELASAVDTGESENNIGRKQRDLSRAERSLESKDTQVNLLEAAGDVIEDLLDQLETVFRMGWFRSLVRTVPEKKLGALASMEHDDDLTKLQTLATAVLEKIKRKRERAETDKERYRREKMALDAQTAKSEELRESTSVKGKMDEELLARARARVAAKNAARAPIPVNATVATPAAAAVETPAANTAQNKA